MNQTYLDSSSTQEETDGEEDTPETVSGKEVDTPTTDTVEEANRTQPEAAASDAPPVPPVVLDRYNFDKTTIVMVVQWRPHEQEDQPRKVWLSVQNGVGNTADSPLYLAANEQEIGPWPLCVTQLLEDLHADLPKRQQRFQDKQRATPATPPPATTKAAVTPKATTTAKQQDKKATPAAPPPVPTSSNPIHKEGLAMQGLFDDLGDSQD